MDPAMTSILASIGASLVVAFVQTVVFRPLQGLPGKVDRLSLLMGDVLDDVEDFGERLTHLEAERFGPPAKRSAKRRRSRRTAAVPGARKD